MNMLQDKVILITGCLGSLGRSAVAMFLDRGATVYGCDRIPLDPLSEIGQLQEQYSEQRFIYKQADMCDELEVQAVIADVEYCFGKLNGTYHNVYTSGWKPAVEMSLEEWDNCIRGTLTSTFLLNKYAIPLLIRSGGGSIVNTSSILGQVVKKESLAYGAAKAGMNQMTRVIAAEYAEQGIRANVLVPGDFDTKESNARQSEQQKAAMKNIAWLGRSGNTDEINEVAAFLLSDASSYVTGSLYQVDGGFH
ncbi:SDR family NAD(P)-dependent oxidoreductase [Cohnella abietis]|uniref:Dihydroanticapsin 7-dehydrogenase n=1 Tax=Cohnella abietis TaxID=2507935 RepID=A0A3T1D0I4_9BACL|nr:SDR family NAD(P)-dependent oxidoreductase [Cohnella abietis]BBI31594.1 dihydroanticapsin 7-dehydrogenase [Cohnella abietis]